MEDPLIYTSHGNVPLDSVTLTPNWTDNEDHTKLELFYHDKVTGELVRNDCYILAKKMLAMGAEQYSGLPSFPVPLMES